MNKSPLLGIFVAMILVVLASSMFIVKEHERGFILRFSKVLKDSQDAPVVYDAGLHFKLPFFDRALKIDARIQTLDGAPDRIVTSNKSDLIVDSYAKWRVTDFGQYYLRTQGNPVRANEILERYVDSEIRTQFGLHSIEEVVASQRHEIIGSIRDAVALKTSEFGIELVDIQVKKVNYPDDIRSNVFGEMKAERERYAKKNRAEGAKIATIIRAETDAEAKILVAEADQEAREVRGNGDAEAAKIYADTYNKNPEFYAFLRSLDAYKASFNSESDVLVLDPNSEFFKYFKNIKVK